MVAPTLKLQGLPEWLRALDRMGKLDQPLRDVLRDFAKDVRARARDHYLQGQALNVFTGALRKSVKTKVRSRSAVIGSDDTAGVVWEAGKRPRKWLSPAFEDELRDAERALAEKWERQVFRGRL